MDMGFIQNDIRDRKSESYRKREREEGKCSERVKCKIEQNIIWKYSTNSRLVINGIEHSVRLATALGGIDGEYLSEFRGCFRLTLSLELLLPVPWLFVLSCERFDITNIGGLVEPKYR